MGEIRLRSAAEALTLVLTSEAVQKELNDNEDWLVQLSSLWLDLHRFSLSSGQLSYLEASIALVQAVLISNPNSEHFRRHFPDYRDHVISRFFMLHRSKMLSRGYQRVECERVCQALDYVIKVYRVNPLSPEEAWLEEEEEGYLPDCPEFAKYRIVDTSLIHHNPLGVQHCRGPRILCIDGGGTRGVVALQMLVYIESLLEGRTIADCFDWIIGTSTGGLIALFLCRGHSVAEALRLYFKLMGKIFCGPKPYSKAVLEAELKSIFGLRTQMRDIPSEQIRCVITSTTGSVENLELSLFTNYDNSTNKFHLWEVARCTSAAPTYFNPYQDPETKICYHDGGLKANNPTQAAITEIVRVEGAGCLKNGIIVSLGTGVSSIPQSNNLNLKVSRRRGAREISLLSTVHDLFWTFANEVTNSNGAVVEDAKATCALAKCFYYRLTPPLPEAMELDETDSVKLVNSMYHTVGYLNNHQAEISEMCERLIRREPEPEAADIAN